ncbi:MAG: hypothetical protein CXR31_05900 [Geobacter sp.]|nr:MAG: hypothetical protein CXR31_05900 [Geobacter sp.]
MPGMTFEMEVDNVIKVYEWEVKHPATRTREMIKTHGEIEALSRLMISADLQIGFKVLRDRGLIEMTFEALVVRFKNLFRPDVVLAAQWRLDHAQELL